MLLGIKTDNPVAELYLYNGVECVASTTWEANRELAHELLRKIDEFLSANGQSLETITGLFVFQGPGSFTGLRIGLTVMNTLSYALSVPIIGESGDEWRDRALQRLLSNEDSKVVMPFYGAEARITAPKK